MITFNLHIDVIKTINTSKKRIFIFFFFNYKNNQSIRIDYQNVQSIITKCSVYSSIYSYFYKLYEQLDTYHFNYFRFILLHVCIYRCDKKLIFFQISVPFQI